MTYPEKTILLHDGRTCTMRVPRAGDAEALIDYLRAIASETEYILWTPQGPFPTKEGEIAYIESLAASPQTLCLLADVDGEVAGNCQIVFNSKWKVAHRSSIVIALKQKFWGLGIGTALLRELLARRNAAAYARQSSMWSRRTTGRAAFMRNWASAPSPRCPPPSVLRTAVCTMKYT